MTPGSQMLVPLPAKTVADAEPTDARVTKRASQLKALMHLGYPAQVAAPYCDGISAVEDLIELIASDNAAQLGTDADDAKLSHARGSTHCAIA